MRLSIFIVLVISIGHSWSHAADVGSNIDARAVQLALQEHTIRASLRNNVEQIPFGVLLRGAYRAAVTYGDISKLGLEAPEGDVPAIVASEVGKEDFFSQRAWDTINEACVSLRGSAPGGEIDIEHFAGMIMLSGDREYEDLKVYYEDLIDELPEHQKLDILELASDSSEPRIDISYSRLDFVSLAQNEPEIALFLANHTCDRFETF